MFLNKLELVNYRNYEKCSLDLTDCKKVIFTGKNAQGKSNLLEAIYYLSSLSSKRVKNDTDFVLWGQSFCFIKGIISKNNVEINLDICLNPPKRKILKVNSIKKNKY